MSGRIVGFIVLVSCLLWVAAGAASAATRYGEVRVEQGRMTVVRDAAAQTFDPSSGSIAVQEEDVIQVGADSRVVLRSPEKATLTLGSNAVFEVRAWERQSDQGFFRLLYGRLRAAVVGLAGGERFSATSATATIGVKGTEYLAAVTTGANTMVVGRESVVAVTGAAGEPQDVSPGRLSVVLVDSAATPSAPVPDEVRAQFGAERLDALPPIVAGARDLPGEAGLIRAGIVSPQELNDAKQESVSPEALEDEAPTDPLVDLRDLGVAVTPEPAIENTLDNRIDGVLLDVVFGL